MVFRGNMALAERQYQDLRFDNPVWYVQGRMLINNASLHLVRARLSKTLPLYRCG